MIKSESIAKLADALSKAQDEMPNAVKDSQNPFYKSKYADLASVREACKKPLSNHGLAIVQIPETDQEGRPMITSLLMHSSGEYIGGSLTMKPVKEDPQGVGSAITYARRYAYSGLTGIATEDDDGNAASAKSDVPRTEVDIPIVPKNANGTDKRAVAPPEDCITQEQASKLHIRFREALPADLQPKADMILYDWLGQQLYVDASGNPSAKAIRKDEFARVGKSAVEFAKEMNS